MFDCMDLWMRKKAEENPQDHHHLHCSNNIYKWTIQSFVGSAAAELESTESAIYSTSVCHFLAINVRPLSRFAKIFIS